jgi:leucyl/phenylalanyl-tRNA--protein transferase
MFHVWEKPHFPHPREAGPDGLLITGGSLAPAWMMEAYRSGIFPMPLNYGHQRSLGWFSPDPRGILELDGFHISRRLARRLRQGEFQFTSNAAFEQVVEACAAPRSQDTGCWLTLAMQNAYLSLHELGAAHSVEAWSGNQLVGGIFGIAIGGFFAGESMFSRRTDASKAALAWLVHHLRCRGFSLLDVQWTNEHTRSLGAIDISREEYLQRLSTAVLLPSKFAE